MKIHVNPVPVATADAAPARIARLHVFEAPLLDLRSSRAGRAWQHPGHGAIDVQRGDTVRAMAAMGRHGENGAGNGRKMVTWKGFRCFQNSQVRYFDFVS